VVDTVHVYRNVLLTLLI